MAFPIVSVEVAFASAPGAATPSWTDVSDYVRELRTRRGRSRELDRYQAGECEFVLANQDRRFDPSYAAGPYFGNVLPMKRVRVQATIDAVTHPVFDGFVDSWEQVYSHPQEAVAVVRCTDAFKVLNAAELPGSVYAAEVMADAPTIWWRLGDLAGTTVARDSSGNNVHGEVVGAPTFGVEGLGVHEPDTAMQVVVQGGREGVERLTWAVIPPLSIATPPGVASGTGAFTVEMLVRLTTIAADNQVLYSESASGETSNVTISKQTGTNQWFFQRGNTSGGGGSVNSTTTPSADVTYHMVFRYDGTNLTIWQDGVDVTGTPGTSSGTVAGLPIRVGHSTNGFSTDAVFDEVALYRSSLSSARIAAHNAAARTPWRGDSPGTRAGRILDEIDWPAGVRDLDAGTSVLQSADLGGTALEHLQKVAESEFGALFVARDGDVTLVARTALVDQTSQATFGDGVGEWEYTEIDLDYSDADIRNDIIVSRANGTSQRVEDEASIAAYLRHSFSMEGLLHDDDELSWDAATAILAQYKDPALRVTHLRLEPLSSNDDLFTEALERELTEWVTVRRRPQDLGSAIEQVAVLEGIEHEISDQHWSTVFRLSPAFTTAFWELGTAGWGELGQTTYLYF